MSYTFGAMLYTFFAVILCKSNTYGKCITINVIHVFIKGDKKEAIPYYV
jgi:hypothetical protein